MILKDFIISDSPKKQNFSLKPFLTMCCIAKECTASIKPCGERLHR